jgi:uncharacterized protein (DUF2062 family)
MLSAIMFLLSDARDFLTVAGLSCFALGVMLLGPIFGILIYFCSKLIYFRLKKQQKLPRTPRGIKMLTWLANALCFPVILFLSWQTFNLFYETYDSLMPLCLLNC